MSKKRIIILSSIICIASILTFVGYKLYDQMFYPEISIKVCEEYDEHETIINIGDDIEKSDQYFYIKDGKLIDYSTHEELVNATYAKVYELQLWVYDDSDGGTLSWIDTSGKTLRSHKIDYSFDDFLIAHNTLFTISGKGVKTYDLGDTLKEVPIGYDSLYKSDKFELKSFTYNGNICVYIDTESFDANAKNSYYTADLSCNNSIYENGKYQILSADKNSVIFTDINDDKNEILIFDEGSKTLKSVEYDGFNIFEKAQNFSTKDKIYWVGQENTSRKFEKDASLKACDDMKNHKHDVLLTIDKNNPDNIDRWETKTFERILYVDDSVIITYYKGKFIRYLTDSKEKINENDSEIKDPGRYSTQSCGLYLFIIDSDGNIIQKTIIG